MPQLPLILYVRIANVGGPTGRLSLQTKQQEDRARTWAEAQGHSIGEVVMDLDYSGTIHPEKRPGMASAMEKIRRGSAGGLAASHIDRFSRDVVHGDWLFQEVLAHGGTLTAPGMPMGLDSWPTAA